MGSETPTTKSIVPIQQTIGIKITYTIMKEILDYYEVSQENQIPILSYPFYWKEVIALADYLIKASMRDRGKTNPELFEFIFTVSRRSGKGFRKAIVIPVAVEIFSAIVKSTDKDKTVNILSDLLDTHVEEKTNGFENNPSRLSLVKS